MTTTFTSPSARQWTAPSGGTSARDFHRSLPGYEPTPLIDLPDLASELGVGRVVVKDESARLGLPAFKVLGASWAWDFPTGPAIVAAFGAACSPLRARSCVRFSRYST